MIINDKYCASNGLNDNINGGTYRSSKFHNLRQQNSISSSFSNTSSSSCSSISPTTTTNTNTIQLLATPLLKQQKIIHTQSISSAANTPKVIPICVPNSKYKLRYPIQNTQTIDIVERQSQQSPYEMSFPVNYAYNQHYGTVPASLSKLKTRSSIGHLINSNSNNHSIKQHHQQPQTSYQTHQHYDHPIISSYQILPQQTTHQFQFQTPQHHNNNNNNNNNNHYNYNNHYENQNVYRQMSNDNINNRNNKQASFDNTAIQESRTNSLNRNSMKPFQPTQNSTRTKIDDPITQSTTSLSASLQKSTSNDSHKINNTNNNSTKFYSLRKILTKNKSLSSNISNSSRSDSSDLTRNKVDSLKSIDEKSNNGFRPTTSNRRLGYSSSFNLNNRTKFEYDPSNKSNTLIKSNGKNSENTNQETSTKETNKDGSKVLRILKIYKNVLSRLQKRFNIHETNSKETFVNDNDPTVAKQKESENTDSIQSSIVITLEEDKSSPTSVDKSTQTRYNFEIIPKESNDDDDQEEDDNEIIVSYDKATINYKNDDIGSEEDILCDLEVASYFNGSNKPTVTNDSYSQPSSFNSLTTSSSGCYTGGGGCGGSGSGSGTSNDITGPQITMNTNATKHYIYDNDKLLLNKANNNYISNNTAVRKSHYENIYDNTTNYNYNYYYNNNNNTNNNNANFIQYGTLC